MSMDGYTLHLLGMVENERGAGETISWRGHADHLSGFTVILDGGENRRWKRTTGTTLADALTALLRDLGVEVPERPSAGQIALWDADGSLPDVEIKSLRAFYRNDRAGCLCWLEGGEA